MGKKWVWRDKIKFALSSMIVTRVIRYSSRTRGWVVLDRFGKKIAMW